MVVAVECSLKNLKNALAEIGYTAVDYETYNFPVDAIVYESIHLKPCSKHNFLNEKLQSGILMIYAKNKTIDEIDNILRTRTYSSLF